MCKADPKRYKRVSGPCTNLDGINPRAKSLMEHLKKQHSRDFRCMLCWKWHKDQEELDKHQAGKPGFQHCATCCRDFKKKSDFVSHRDGKACKLNPMTRPELFSPEQEQVFQDMKHQSSKKGTIEQKFLWCFAELHPHHPEKDSILPWYDFAILKQELPYELSREQLDMAAGGVRQTVADASSPSDQETPVDTSTSPTDTRRRLARAAASDNVFIPSFERSQHDGNQIHNQLTAPGPTFDDPDYNPMWNNASSLPSNTSQVANYAQSQASSHPRVRTQLHAHRFSSFSSSAAPSLTRTGSQSTHANVPAPPYTPVQQSVFPPNPSVFMFGAVPATTNIAFPPQSTAVYDGQPQQMAPPIPPQLPATPQGIWDADEYDRHYNGGDGSFHNVHDGSYWPSLDDSNINFDLPAPDAPKAQRYSDRLDDPSTMDPQWGQQP